MSVLCLSGYFWDRQIDTILWPYLVLIYDMNLWTSKFYKEFTQNLFVTWILRTMTDFAHPALRTGIAYFTRIFPTVFNRKKFKKLTANSNLLYWKTLRSLFLQRNTEPPLCINLIILVENYTWLGEKAK